MRFGRLSAISFRLLESNSLMSRGALGVVLSAMILGCGLEVSGETIPTWTVSALREQAEMVPVVELPAKAAEIVASALEEDRKRLAVRTVRIFLSERHSLAPSLVGAICRAAPEVSVAVTAEAVRLFPESAYSIVRAAVASAPEFAVSICLQSTIAEPDRVRQIVNGLRRGDSSKLPEFQVLVTAMSSATEEMVDAAVQSTRNRIGTSTLNKPANPNDPRDNNPAGQPQLKFLDGMEVPEDLSGGELISHFDRIRRELLLGDGNQFDDDVVIQDYVR